MLDQGAAPSLALMAAARALSCDQIAAEVTSALRDAAVPTILLKGPSIARWLYPSGGRSYIDTDILVPGRDFGRAQEVLRSLGFAESLGDFHPFERGAPSAEVSFGRPGAPRGPAGVVDLHRSLPMLRVSDELVWQALSAGTATADVGGAKVRVLGRTALALHVVLHAVQHRFTGHTTEDLRRAVADLPGPDWRPVAELAARLGVGDILGFGLRQEPAGADLADRLGLPLRAPAESHYWARYAPQGSISLAGVWSDPTWRAKAQRIRWALLPSPSKIRYVLGVPDAHGRSLLLGYARWWRHVARTIVPAARCVIGHQRAAEGDGEAG
jgi:putative nucleotidyltransferase-like protein